MQLTPEAHGQNQTKPITENSKRATRNLEYYSLFSIWTSSIDNLLFESLAVFVEVKEVTKPGLGTKWSYPCKQPECSSHELASPFHTTPKTNTIYRFFSLNTIDSPSVYAFRFMTRDFLCLQECNPLPGLLFVRVAGQNIDNVTVMQHFSREILTHYS